MDLSVLGSILGGAAGTAVAPGIGTTIGSQLGGAIGKSASKGGKPGSSSGSGMSFSPQSALSIGTGLLQTLQANNLKKQANSAMPDLIDPNQSSYLAELAQKRKSIDTGADFAADMNYIDSQNAATNEAITKNTGGDVGGTIQALLQSQRVSSDAKNNVLSRGHQQQFGYNQMFGDMLNKISAKQLQLQLYRSQQARAEWAKKKQQANQNMMAGIGNLIGSGSITTAASAPSAAPVGKVSGALAPGSSAPGSFSNGQEQFIDTNTPIDNATLNPPGQIV